MEELGEVEGKWRELGYRLFIPTSKLDVFAATRQSDCDCLRALMEYWIDTHPCPSWRWLVIALFKMHMFTLAGRVRDKCGGGEPLIVLTFHNGVYMFSVHGGQECVVPLSLCMF